MAQVVLADLVGHLGRLKSVRYVQVVRNDAAEIRFQLCQQLRIHLQA